MIESPLINELQSEARAEGEMRGCALSVLRILEVRFTSVAPELRESLLRVRDERRLVALLDEAAQCPDLVAFQAALDH